MGKRGDDAEEMRNEVLQVLGTNQDCENHQIVVETESTTPQTQQHPYAFHVSGPRNVPSMNWRDLINSTWSVLSSHLLQLFFFFCLAHSCFSACMRLNLWVYVFCLFFDDNVGLRLIGGN